MATKPSAPPSTSSDLRIADHIRHAILSGRLIADDRLPGEQELAQRFGVSRPTVREALKRLAAQNLIRTKRGNAGGSFVNRLSWGEAQTQLESTASALVHLAPIGPDQVAEARLSLLCACAPLAAQRRGPRHLEAMRAEIEVQRATDSTDQEFCASDTRFNRALVDAACNPLLSFQMTGVVEALQSLLDRITFPSQIRGRDRGPPRPRRDHAGAARCFGPRLRTHSPLCANRKADPRSPLRNPTPRLARRRIFAGIPANPPASDLS